jgi:hypothetical protein
MTLVLSAIGVVISLAALALAIYLNVYREQRLRPRLEMLFDYSEGSDLISLKYPREGDCAEHWLRLRVRNARNRRTAEGVEVTFIGCKSENDETPDLPLESRHLRWSATAQPKPDVDALAPDAPEPAISATIAPGFYRYLDFLHASNRVKVDQRLRSVPRVCTWPPASERNRLEPGSYAFCLAITAHDANASFYELKLTYDGQWSSMRDLWWGQHLQVGELRKLPDFDVQNGLLTKYLGSVWLSLFTMRRQSSPRCCERWSRT